MSVELPETLILATQMKEELPGKIIKSYHLKDCEKLQRIGMVNKDTSVYERLVGGKVASVTSRGNTILTKLDNSMNLVLALEYGGIARNPGAKTRYLRSITSRLTSPTRPG